MRNDKPKKNWAGIVITVLVTIPFLLSSTMKFSGSSEVVKGFDHLGWPQAMIFRLAIIEMICAVFYLIPATSVLGAILLTGYTGGIIATHLRVGEPILMASILGVLIWLGIFLREKRLAEVLPTRAGDFVQEREIVINRPQKEVFAYLKPLSNFKNWNPFLRKDPNAKLAHRGVDGEIGYVATWDGNRDMGSGEQEITRIVNGERIEFELRFLKPFAATNQGQFATESLGPNQTKVRWMMTGKTKFPMTIICMFMDMDKMIGGEFEWGLNKLKTILEKGE